MTSESFFRSNLTTWDWSREFENKIENTREKYHLGNFLECAYHRIVTNLENTRSDEINFCGTHTKFGKFLENLGVEKN